LFTSYRLQVPRSPRLSATRHKIRSFFRLKSQDPAAANQKEPCADDDRSSSRSSSGGKSDKQQQQQHIDNDIISEEQQLEDLLSCEAVVGVHYRMAEGYR